MKSINRPRLEHVCLVAENIVLLTVREGEVTGGVQEPYLPQSGETLEQDRDIPALVYIVRDGKRVGVKVEDRQKGTQRFPFETVVGEALDREKADDPESYRVNGQRPWRVFRKTKPNNMADPDGGYTYLHRLYLVLPAAIREGEGLSLHFAEGLFERNSEDLIFRAEALRSEAVQVNQLGYRADDPSKKAWLSQWMGLGGGISYDAVRVFHLVSESGERVYTGAVRPQHGGEAVPGGLGELSTDCPLYELDFSDFQAEGVYRVTVPGVGCSFPFAIGQAGTWETAFRASMNALYCQRSGIVTGKPYSDFERPRCYHPDDGRVIYQSGCSLFESGNGLNCYGTDTNNFGNLLRKATDEVVENAWGGTFDACDWDRRIQHLRASRLETELYLMFPDYFDALSLPIPEQGNGVADVLSEACWNIDFYRRLQLPDGGIRGGIEQEEHPILGQCGWQDTWKAYAYAPDFWSSWYYASAAARMAFALKHRQSERAEAYEESARRAFDWAERSYAALLPKEGHKWTRRAHAGARTERENAAADLFRLTGEERFDALYRSIRSDENLDACFTYATLPDALGDASTRELCRKAILEAAERALRNGEKLPYHLTSEDLAHDRLTGFGAFCTVPRNMQLIRAHFLTGDRRYLTAAIAAADFALGANPDNLCLTTGLGKRCPENILHHDSRMTGQKPPAGITVFGPQDFNHPDDAFPRLIRADFLWPGAYVWPTVEGYLDIYRHPCVTEYTVQGTLGPNAYQWGYFAARAALDREDRA
jgi:endoglucanase